MPFGVVGLEGVGNKVLDGNLHLLTERGNFLGNGVSVIKIQGYCSSDNTVFSHLLCNLVFF